MATSAQHGAAITRPLRILVLDGDCNAACSIVQSLGAAGYECWLAAPEMAHYAFASRYVARAVTYPNPLLDKRAFQEWVMDLHRRHSFALIVPPSECTLIPLHEIRSEPGLERVLALPPRLAVEMAFDKERVRELAASLGIPTPESLLARSSENAGVIDAWLAEGAVVVKGVRSKVWNGTSGSERRVAYATSREILDRLVREHECAVQLQRWVPGKGVGIEMLVDRGEIVLSFAHERIHELPLTGGGSSYRRSIAAPPELLADAAKLMRALEWHGVAMVEFRVHATGYWLMEINGRFWGSLPLASFAGVDFPKALVDLLLHRARPHRVEARTDVYARNLARDLQWTKAVLKHDRNDQRLITRPLSTSLFEWARVLSGKEIWDGARLLDPGPIFFELVSTLRGELATMRKKARRLRAHKTPRMLRGKRRLLVLCRGNICRSAYAEARLSKHTGFEVRSAGFYPEAERPSPPHFVALAAARGVDLSGHRSRVVTRDDVAWADVVVIMDARNHDELTALDPAASSKAFWLGALDRGPLEIEDPYELPTAAAQAILERMDRCLDRLALEVRS